MKNIIYIMILMFFSSFSLAQENKTTSEINKFQSTIDFPLEIKSTKVYKINSSEFTKHIQYSEALKGEVLVITDSNNKLVYIQFPETTSTNEKVSDAGKCFKEAFWNENGGTGWSGFWSCLNK